MNFHKAFLLSALIFLQAFMASAKEYNLSSPDKKIRITVVADKKLSWSVFREKETILKFSNISLRLSNGEKPGENPIINKTEKKGIDGLITAVIPVKNKIIPEQYNELKLSLKGGFDIAFRAYNDGVAYRFESLLPDAKVQILDEVADFNFSENCDIFLPQESDREMQSHYEGKFKRQKLSEINTEQYGYLPLHISTSNGTKIVLTEADLYDYPNLFLFGTGGNSLKAAYTCAVAWFGSWMAFCGRAIQERECTQRCASSTDGAMADDQNATRDLSRSPATVNW